MLVKGSVEDLIYILIGVVWIAFSIYKGMQKKKQQTPPPDDVDYDYEPEPEPEKKKTAFESFLDEILVEEEPVPYKPVEYEPVSESTPETKPTEKIFSYDDYYEESNVQEGFEVYKGADTQSTIKKQPLSTSHKKRRKPHFNLRKAVIYSEILKRPYL
jgi:hypothetical protein